MLTQPQPPPPSYRTETPSRPPSYHTTSPSTGGDGSRSPTLRAESIWSDATTAADAAPEDYKRKSKVPLKPVPEVYEPEVSLNPAVETEPTQHPRKGRIVVCWIVLLAGVIVAIVIPVVVVFVVKK